MDKNLYLTFDDGPSEPYTSQVLEALAEHNAKATFFVCGRNIERSPQSIQKIVTAGHAIGIHSYFHDPKKVALGTLAEEIEETRGLIKKYAGIDTVLYRSPWGITRRRLRQWLEKRGYETYHWNIMAFDWWQPSAHFIARHILGRVFPGAIILLHDGDQTRSGSRMQTVEAVKKILVGAKKQGYQFYALHKGYNNPAGKITNMAKDIILGLLHY